MAFYYDRIRQLRKKKGISQAKLAQALNLGTSTISMYETKDRTPDFETIEALCEYFQVNMSTFSDRLDKTDLNTNPLEPTTSPTQILNTIFTKNDIDALQALDFGKITIDKNQRKVLSLLSRAILEIITASKKD